jgi:predicted porin
VTPTIGGFRFGALYALGGVSGDVSRNQVISAGMHYGYGAFATGAGYMNARNPNISFFGTSSQATLTAATTNATSPAFSGFLLLQHRSAASCSWDRSLSFVLQRLRRGH